ncbi:MAG: tautomerase family protein [Candidatus Hodarchaeales archaeon]|jgi:phenylpyruvate tautomerase PptA (4-oxalocrotonate tautomerase family)
MPLIEYTSFDVDPETKRKLIIGLSKTASEITGITTDHFTVVIREVSGRESFGINGKPLP